MTDSFKLTAWNIKHCDKLLDELSDTDPNVKRRADIRMDAIAEEFKAIDADICLITEGPNGEDRATEFFERAAPGYSLIKRGSADRDDYGMKGSDAVTGRQWIWFLLRQDLHFEAQLLHLDKWREHTELQSKGDHANGRWNVSYPKFKSGSGGNDTSLLEFSIPERAYHWRHPQVLQLQSGDAFFEIVGCHLKSKINRTRINGNPTDEDFFENNKKLVAELIKARVRITTECQDIRHYINHRFEQDSDAAIIVCGDFNDGPGKERIERRFLYHDLIGTLQGDVFLARRFLNHALFDFEESERWSVYFKDKLEPGRNPKILLDHILFSQSMTGSHTGDKFAFKARSRSGLVEHQIHHAVTSTRPKYAETSDHLPVSMHFDRREHAHS
ncbi:MAG: endonuclease/exonuclease/phosphatase [Ahrensia sp.]|nr:endonuclease/exonuclease/phosphatase [Ahrensia sp.]